MELEPPDSLLVSLEEDAEGVIGHDWYKRLDKVFTDNLGKFRKYKGNSVRDLLRALRNKVSALLWKRLTAETSLSRSPQERPASPRFTSARLPAILHLSLSKTLPPRPPSDQTQPAAV